MIEVPAGNSGLRGAISSANTIQCDIDVAVQVHHQIGRRDKGGEQLKQFFVGGELQVVHVAVFVKYFREYSVTGE